MSRRFGVYIDGSNFFATIKALDVEIDYSKFRKWIASLALDLQCTSNRVNYYTALKKDDDGFIKIQRMVDWLQYNEYNVITKEAKIFHRGDGATTVKGNVDIEIAVDTLTASVYEDVMMLATGDGDFKYLIEELRRRGVQVWILSSIKTTPSYLADELRKSADVFIDIADHITELSSNRKEEENVELH